MTAEGEIVRCKDCRWFGHPGCWLDNAVAVNQNDAPGPEDFCSKAERGEKENPGFNSKNPWDWVIPCKLVVEGL